MGEYSEALKRARAERRQTLTAPQRSRPRTPLARAAAEPPERGDRPPSGSLIAFPGTARPTPPVRRDGVLGSRGPSHSISAKRRGAWRARLCALDRPGPAAEAFRHLALRLTRDLERRGRHSVLLTSATGCEGRTTTATNLALALATVFDEGRVALLDLDFRRPGVARALGIEPLVGIERALAGQVSVNAVGLRTERPGIDVFPALAPVKRAHELLVGKRLGQLIHGLERRYRLVVVDAPAAVPVPDARLILEHVGACLPLARGGVTRLASFEQMLDLLPGEKILGPLLNGARPLSRPGGYED